ncbi:MAG: type II toxin-antitoxin system HicB family antitoxin [candidate division WOR-3 bacterium]
MKSVTAIIHKGENYFIGECLEVDVVTQGKTIDEVLSNLKEAIALYFENEDIEQIPLPKEPMIAVPIVVE